KATNNDNLIIPFASLFFLGNTIAIGYVNAATGIIILIIALKVPITPKASGPYILVMTGENSIVIACAPAVPLATITTFLMNLFLVNCFIISNPYLIFFLILL